MVPLAPGLPLSINQVCTRTWRFEEDIAFLARHGYPAISLHMPKLEATGVARAEALVRGAGLRVALINSTGFFSLADPAALRAQQARTMHHLEWAARLGAPAVLLIAGAALGYSWEEQRDLFYRAVEPILPEAERHGIRLGIEHHSSLKPELSFVHRFHDALDIVEALGSPYLGVILECNNAWVERDLYTNIARRQCWIVIVQVNDFRPPVTGTNQRVPVGDGVIPLRRILAALRAAGYTGDYDLELIGHAAAIERSVAALNRLWNETAP
jgi:sugar phosphate isomerase/epimerase